MIRRLLPAPQLPSQNTEGGEAAKAVARQVFWQRCRHHLLTFHATCYTGFEWFLARRQMDRAFLTFLLLSVAFDFGEFVFFLLYNLYLVDRGFDERFIGQVSSAMTAGTFVGALVAPFVLRVGLRNFIMLAVGGSAAAAVCRSVVLSHGALLGSAFANGIFLSFSAVAMAPAVASLTGERHRTFGFSLIGSAGIGVGAIAGLLGGHLPSALQAIRPSLASVDAKSMALLIGAALAASAIFPAAFMRFPASPPTEKVAKKYPNTPFLRAFLVALFLWTLGTSGFNPFISVFFSKRLHAGVEQVGLAFTYSQMAQVGAVLLAPAILQRAGVIRGIVFIQLATAAALGSFAFVTSLQLGTLLYVAYMSFQYMTEPCLLSMLMTRVDPSERGGASSLNFLVTSLAASVAATAAGYGMAQSGYSGTISILAAITALSAVIFSIVVRA